jgi:hypothetical protein
MHLLRAEPTERPTMTQANEGFAAVTAGRPVPPHVLMAGSGQTWRSSQPTVAVGSDTPTHALGPAGAGPTRLNPRPCDATQATARVGAGHTGTRPPGSRPPGAYPAEEPPGRSRKRSWLIGALAVAAAAVIGILLAGAFFNSKPPANATSQSISTTTVPTTSSQATTSTTTTAKKTTTTETPTTTPPTTTTTSAPSQFSVQDMKNFIINYYAAAPTSPDTTYSTMLTSNMQSASGGLATYKRYWTAFDSAAVTNVAQTGNAFRVKVTYTWKNGQQGTEVTDLTLVSQGGQLLIDKEHKIQSLPPASSSGAGSSTTVPPGPTG